MSSIDKLLERNLLPDPLLHFGIRRLLRQRLREERHPTAETEQEALENFIRHMRTAPVALQTKAANEQHYEVPTEFFTHCLGPRMKYSSGLWNGAVTTLDEAETAMLRLTCERAELADGQRILELGCGWGSLTLWMAENYPQATIVAVSNSRTQKEHIDDKASELGLSNITIVTADMNDFQTGETFDRVVSVEMFEHMRNWEKLLERIAHWLTDDGKFFLHIFTHRDLTYPFEDRDASDWMSRHFFSGGMMPGSNLLLRFQNHLQVEKQWQVSGHHYARTAEAWLRNMDRNKSLILPIFDQTYGASNTRKWWAYWRVFYMACIELWGFNDGREWMVSHYRLKKDGIRTG